MEVSSHPARAPRPRGLAGPIPVVVHVLALVAGLAGTAAAADAPRAEIAAPALPAPAPLSPALLSPAVTRQGDAVVLSFDRLQRARDEACGSVGAGDAAGRRAASWTVSLAMDAGDDRALAELTQVDTGTARECACARLALVESRLREQAGAPAFERAVAEVLPTAESTATWADLQRALESASGDRFDDALDQWVDRPGLPRLSLRAVVDDGGVLRGRIVQGGPPGAQQDGAPYVLPGVEIGIVLASGGRQRASVDVAGEGAPFELPLDGLAHRVELDPDWRVPRYLGRDQRPPCLQETAGGTDGRGMLVVYPSAPESADSRVTRRMATYRALAEAVVAKAGGQTMAVKDVAEIEFTSNCVLLIGSLIENPFIRRVAPALSDVGVDVTRSGSFRAGARRFTAPDAALLATCRHPDRAGATVTVFVPNDEAALRASEGLFDHPRATWVALAAGVRGDAAPHGVAWPEDTPDRIELAPPWPAETPAERMLETVARLGRVELEGRDGGSPGARAAARELGERLESMGLRAAGTQGALQPFTFLARDIPKQPLLFGRGEERLLVPVVPASYWLPVPGELQPLQGSSSLAPPPASEPVVLVYPAGLVFAGDADPGAFRGVDVRRALAVVVDRTELQGGSLDAAREAEEAHVRRLLAVVSAAEQQGALGVLVVRPDADPPELAALASHPPFAAAGESRPAASSRQEGARRSELRAATAANARGEPFARAVRATLLFGGRPVLQELEARGWTERGARAFEGGALDVRFHLETELLADRNVVALVPGTDPLRDGIVMLSAPFDGPGLAADGRATQGAADDAAGVAVALEVARRLMLDPPPTTVAITFPGARHWGLQGSRVLAATWPKHLPVDAVVNLNGAGHGNVPLRLLGAARAPRIAEIVKGRAAQHGVQVSPDASPEALGRHAADHWSWVQARVPALTLSQADPNVAGTPGDTIDRLDGPALERLADTVEATVRGLAR